MLWDQGQRQAGVETFENSEHGAGCKVETGLGNIAKTWPCRPLGVSGVQGRRPIVEHRPGSPAGDEAVANTCFATLQRPAGLQLRVGRLGTFSLEQLQCSSIYDAHRVRGSSMVALAKICPSHNFAKLEAFNFNFTGARESPT